MDYNCNSCRGDCPGGRRRAVSRSGYRNSRTNQYRNNSNEGCAVDYKENCAAPSCEDSCSCEESCQSCQQEDTCVQESSRCCESNLRPGGSCSCEKVPCQDCGCRSRFRPTESMPVGMTYTPIQEFDMLYELEDALEAGTIFKELNLPFRCDGCAKGGRI